MSTAVGVTVFGCDRDESAMIREMAAGIGVIPIVTTAAVSDATIGLAAGTRCISVGHKTDITNAHLDALRRVGVRYLSTRSIGDNHVDVQYAEHIGITVENTMYSPDSVADYTLMLMLMAIRNVKTTLRRADLHDYRLPAVRGRELRDMTVGVVGTGRIGAAVIDRLGGFGARVLAADPRPKQGAEYVTLDELLERSDIVTLHAPLRPTTHHLIDRDRIERMPHGAVVINTGRGGLVDTEALLSALERGRLGGAALDVIEEEDGMFYADRSGDVVEQSALTRLQRLPNAIITPHTAYFTDHALRDTVENSLRNCVRFEREMRVG